MNAQSVPLRLREQVREEIVEQPGHFFGSRGALVAQVSLGVWFLAQLELGWRGQSVARPEAGQDKPMRCSEGSLSCSQADRLFDSGQERIAALVPAFAGHAGAVESHAEKIAQ